VAPVRKSKIVERRKTNPTPLAARLYRPHFYSDEPHPTSPQVPAFSDTLRRFGLWDPAQPTQGLLVLLGHHFFAGNVAPCFYWERMNRSTPQQELGSDGVGGMPKEANTPHPNFHIVASLPGLNDPAFNRRAELLKLKTRTLNESA
jgi:hypothetical protein